MQKKNCVLASKSGCLEQADNNIHTIIPILMHKTQFFFCIFSPSRFIYLQFLSKITFLNTVLLTPFELFFQYYMECT